MADFDAAKDFRDRSLNPDHPVLRGSAQNPDVFFQARESCLFTTNSQLLLKNI